MAFSTTIQKVATKKLLKTFEIKLNGSIVLGDDRIIDRVIDGYGVVNITSNEKVGDIDMIGGNVRFNGVFNDQNKQLFTECVNLDFTERQQLGEAEGVCFVGTIKNYKLLKESEKSASISVVVSVFAYGVVEDEISLVGGEDDGYCLKTNKIEFDKLSASTTTNFSVTDNFEIVDNDVEIVYSGAECFVDNIQNGENFVTVNGSVCVQVAYLSGVVVKRVNKIVEFSQEIALLGVNDKTIIDSMLSNKGVLVSIQKNEEGSKTELLFDVSIGCTLWGFERKECELVEDMFAFNKDVLITSTTIENTNVLPQQTISDRQTFVLDVSSIRRVDEIWYVGQLNPVVSMAKIENGKGYIEGDLLVPIVYNSYDGEDNFGSVLQTPFNLSFNLDENVDNANFEYCLICHENSIKNKVGKEISLTVDFELAIVLHKENTEQYVCGFEEVGEVVNKSHSVVVYHPDEDQTLFDIAKELKVSPDVILAQNPAVVDNKKIDRIVVYKRID